VNFTDVLLTGVASLQWYLTGTYNQNFDVDGDGDVDLSDVLFVASRLGTQLP
jgi:hypothetical protein